MAACRTDAPERFHQHRNGNYSGLGGSISRDDGRTWSKLLMLFEWGCHHSSWVVLPGGDLVMSYAVRRGYPDTPHGFPQMGIEAVVSHDHGRTWDLDHRYLLTTWPGLVKGAGAASIAQSQSTSSVLLPGDKILTIYGGSERAARTTPGASEPHDSGAVLWRPNLDRLAEDRSFRRKQFCLVRIGLEIKQLPRKGGRIIRLSEHRGT